MGNLVEPMIWHYNSAETFQLGTTLWDKYTSVFTNIWAATAFKGSTSSCQTLPINKYHVSNHEAWLSELSVQYNKIPNFRGVVLTGWSRFVVYRIFFICNMLYVLRYDHYATLCELLPCAIPTLCLCMKTWLLGEYNEEVHA